MDRSLYLDVNRFARQTVGLHGFMTAYALWAGVTLLGILLIAGWWESRFEGRRAVAAMIWAGGGTLAAVGLNQPFAHLVGRVRPYDVIKGAEVLVPRAHDFTFPSDHATAAGAVICGLFLARRYWLGALASFLGLLLAFARVYVGAHYPSDVIAGLVFGAVVVAALAPVGFRLAGLLVNLCEATPLRPLVLSPHVSGDDSQRSGRSRKRVPASPKRSNRGHDMRGGAMNLDALEALGKASRDAREEAAGARQGLSSSRQADRLTTDKTL